MAELDRFREASPELQKEAKDKWYRLMEKGVIDAEKPWPFDPVAVEIEPTGEEYSEPESDEIKSWRAYDYMKDDPNFIAFRSAYENLGADVYEQALKQTGLEAVTTSEECGEIAKRMETIADMQKF